MWTAESWLTSASSRKLRETLPAGSVSISGQKRPCRDARPERNAPASFRAAENACFTRLPLPHDEVYAAGRRELLMSSLLRATLKPLP